MVQNRNTEDEIMQDSGTIANAMLADGDTSWSSIADFVQHNSERGIELMKYALMKRTETQSLVQQLEQQLNRAKSLLKSHEAAIYHTARHLKLKYPFSLQVNSDTAIIKEDGTIELIPIVAVG